MLNKILEEKMKEFKLKKSEEKIHKILTEELGMIQNLAKTKYIVIVRWHARVAGNTTKDTTTIAITVDVSKEQIVYVVQDLFEELLSEII